MGLLEARNTYWIKRTLLFGPVPVETEITLVAAVI